MPWTCRCWSAMNTHHITILQARSVQKISTVCLFTHLRIITHPFTSWGSSFLTIYTQASVPGRYHWSCSENIRKSWWWTQQIIKRIVFVFHCSTSAGQHFQMHPFQSLLHFCQVKIKNHLNGFLRGSSCRSIEHEASRAKTYGIREHKVGGDDSWLASSYIQRAAA